MPEATSLSLLLLVLSGAALKLLPVRGADAKGELPAWYNATSHWPYSTNSSTEFMRDGDDGCPVYVGQQQADACPEQLKFTCVLPGHGTKTDRVRSCTKGGNSGAHKVGLACHAYPEKWTGGTHKKVNAFGSITRRHIIERAMGWLANGYEYRWHYNLLRHPLSNWTGSGLEACASDDGLTCPQQRYLSDCVGYVSMAWKLPVVNPNVCTVANSPWVEKIDCKDARPGDAYIWTMPTSKKKCKYPHIQMFRRWVKGQEGKMWTVWQQGGNDNKVHAWTTGLWKYKARKTNFCIRRNRIIEDRDNCTARTI